MPYPSYAYLTPQTLHAALELASELHNAARNIENLLHDGGRLARKAEAVSRWRGPHRDTFDQLFDNEIGSARTAARLLEDEAAAWARFWAMATDARNDRLHDEAMEQYHSDLRRHEDRLAALERSPADADHGRPLPRPVPPVAPTAPDPTEVPGPAHWPSYWARPR